MLQGQVLVQVAVEQNGSISLVSLISGDPTLGHAVANVVHKWKFESFTQNGHPVRVQQKLLFNFIPDEKTAELQLPLQAPTAGPVPSGTGIYRVGVGVSVPRVLYAPDPEYSEEARRAKYQGTCVLSLIVGPDGLPRDIRVANSLGMGLDEKAIEAIRTWRFDPARKDGKPVSVAINVEVTFRL